MRQAFKPREMGEALKEPWQDNPWKLKIDN